MVVVSKMPDIRLPERNKKAGVCYAVTNDGLELPVVDVTHPAFKLTLSAEQERLAVEHFLEEQRRFAKVPAPLRRLLLRWALRGSIMGRGLRRADGTFLDGSTTYLFKLGPKNLGAYARPIDRRIAASLPALALRLRLGDMARLLADELVTPLQASKRPLWLLNIAGGAAVDSLNALILLEREQPQLLAERRCVICVLDADEGGPAFGQRALQALLAPGAPLSGVNVELRRMPYDWRSVAGLQPAFRAMRSEDALGIVSSEGGLFEYGTDEDILANLGEIAASSMALSVVGSVTRDNETIRTLKLTSTAATKPRGLEAFSALIARTGFRVTRSIARPLSDQVVLRPGLER